MFGIAANYLNVVVVVVVVISIQYKCQNKPHELGWCGTYAPAADVSKA